mmetsp:Transcript_15663/g.36701  ORF Transcript_15663/g.36701 Transcript_15663/m.36701 type:complete len:500 (-) Transcript_15663:74-1573(-)
MAPILSKPKPTPTTAEQVTKLVNQKLRPVLSTLLDVFAESLVRGQALTREAYESIGQRIDSAIHGSVRILEDYFGLDLQKNARGPRKPLQSSLPILFVLMLIMMLYHAFVFAYMPAAGIAWNSKVSILFHAFVFLVLASFVQATRTDPGGVPDSAAWRTEGQPPPELKERKRQSEEARWCRKTGMYKPDRAHYCRVLKRPVLRMDHHCPWLGNTIGFGNHKYFFLFLLYANAACAFLGCSVVELLVQATLPALSTFLLLGAGALTTILSSFLVPFFLFHCWLIARNSTTIEFCEKMRSSQDGEGSGAESGKSLYDLGLLRNLQAFLGDNPLLWPFPVGSPSGDGLHFPVRSPSKRKPQPDESPASEDSDPEAVHPSAEKSTSDPPLSDDGEPDHPNPCLASCPRLASSLGDDFLVWKDAAEFKDDLQVGYEYLTTCGCVTDLVPSPMLSPVADFFSFCTGDRKVPLSPSRAERRIELLSSGSESQTADSESCDDAPHQV